MREYFGDGDECHMAYHFPLMPRMYMAIAQEDRYPMVEIMQQTPEIPASCQWAIFLRNHDELTLEMVTSQERDYMYRMYAADARARINLGIRRRLAPLMENDLDRIKLMNSLLLSMPGSPIIYYGDEIGMGDNIYLGDRNGVRTPMQWSPDRNAGFSRADPQRLYLPPIMDPVYGYQAVNVEAQSRDAVLAPQLDAAHARGAEGRATRSAAAGCAFLKPGNRKVLAYLREYGDEAILCVANLVALRAAGRARPRALSRAACRSRLLGRTRVPADRRAALPADAAALRLLLVPARDRRRGAGLARGAARARRPAGAGALRRLDELLPRPGRAVADRHGARRCASSWRPRCCRATSSAALVRRQGRALISARRLVDHASGRPRLELAAAIARDRGRRRSRSRATSCRSRSGGRSGTRSG